MPRKADCTKEELTFVTVTDPRQMRTSTFRRTVRARAAVKGHDGRREQLAREAEALSSNTQSFADEQQQRQADLDQQNERAFAVARTFLTRVTQPDLQWELYPDNTVTSQTPSTADRCRTVQRLIRPRPVRETARFGYLGITDPRSYRLNNMRESLRHHPAHAICLSYAESTATSFPDPKTPCSLVGETIEVGSQSRGPHFETQNANGNRQRTAEEEKKWSGDFYEPHRRGVSRACQRQQRRLNS